MDPAAAPNVSDSAAAVHRVRAYSRARDLKPNAFAALTGVSEAALRHMHREGWNPTVRTLEKLEAVIPPDWQSPGPVESPAQSAAPIASAAE